MRLGPPYGEGFRSKVREDLFFTVRLKQRRQAQVAQAVNRQNACVTTFQKDHKEIQVKLYKAQSENAANQKKLEPYNGIQQAAESIKKLQDGWQKNTKYARRVKSRAKEALALLQRQCTLQNRIQKLSTEEKKTRQLLEQAVFELSVVKGRLQVILETGEDSPTEGNSHTMNEASRNELIRSDSLEQCLLHTMLPRTPSILSRLGVNASESEAEDPIGSEAEPEDGLDCKANVEASASQRGAVLDEEHTICQDRLSTAELPASSSGQHNDCHPKYSPDEEQQQTEPPPCAVLNQQENSRAEGMPAGGREYAFEDSLPSCRMQQERAEPEGSVVEGTLDKGTNSEPSLPSCLREQRQNWHASAIAQHSPATKQKIAIKASSLPHSVHQGNWENAQQGRLTAQESPAVGQGMAIFASPLSDILDREAQEDLVSPLSHVLEQNEQEDFQKGDAAAQDTSAYRQGMAIEPSSLSHLVEQRKQEETQHRSAVAQDTSADRQEIAIEAPSLSHSVEEGEQEEAQQRVGAAVSFPAEVQEFTAEPLLSACSTLQREAASEARQVVSCLRDAAKEPEIIVHETWLSVRQSLVPCMQEADWVYITALAEGRPAKPELPASAGLSQQGGGETGYFPAEEKKVQERSSEHMVELEVSLEHEKAQYEPKQLEALQISEGNEIRASWERAQFSGSDMHSMQEADLLHARVEVGIQVLEYLQKQQAWAALEEKENLEPLIWGAASLIEIVLHKADHNILGNSPPGRTYDIDKAAQEVCKKLDSCREIANFLEEAAFQGFMFHRTAEDRLRMGQLQDKLSIARTWTAVLQETAAQAPKAAQRLCNPCSCAGAREAAKIVAEIEKGGFHSLFMDDSPLELADSILDHLIHSPNGPRPCHGAPWKADRN